VLHNITPHFHCSTDSQTSSSESSHTLHTGIHHSHQHEEHNHHHTDETESSWLDAFLGLLGDLEHHDLGEGHFENFTAQSQNFDFNISILDVVDCKTMNFNICSTFITSFERIKDFLDRPPIIYEQHYVCSTPLRGPPTIS